jgi:hypothetical protein
MPKTWRCSRLGDAKAKTQFAPVWRTHMVWKAMSEWSQKRKLRGMLNDPRSARGVRSIAQLEKGIGADRSTTERLLLALGARKSATAEEWTLTPP